ncbi:hypothetical protein [uncultured Roseobacter sp.]|uniref:hypothetical protein n=1 Tax=uncultured Roseobacter sp. TaxID=114847 RepID=UPI00261E0D67|nr:hypothetical protein [uncultured Roseobacter sp.]
MLENLRNIDLTAKDIELIESALHTQKKILSVQSQAGGRGARKKLTDLKHLMKRLNRATPVCDEPPVGFFQTARAFFSTGDSCPHTR